MKQKIKVEKERVQPANTKSKVLLLISIGHFLKTIMPTRTNGTVTFDLTNRADPLAKAKEPFLCQSLDSLNQLNIIFYPTL